jgi:hypothetical protein
VRYIVIFNNGSTTGPNGVIELSLAPHRATVLTTRHSPAEIARKKSRVGGGGGMFPLELPGASRLQSLREIFRAEMLFTSAMPAHAEKNGGRRVLIPIKRANSSAVGLCDRAAGPDSRGSVRRTSPRDITGSKSTQSIKRQGSTAPPPTSRRALTASAFFSYLVSGGTVGPCLVVRRTQSNVRLGKCPLQSHTHPAPSSKLPHTATQGHLHTPCALQQTHKQVHTSAQRLQHTQRNALRTYVVQREPTPGGPGPGLCPGRRCFTCQLPLWFYIYRTFFVRRTNTNHSGGGVIAGNPEASFATKRDLETGNAMQGLVEA